MFNLTIEMLYQGDRVLNNIDLARLKMELLILSELYDEYEYDYYITEVA